VGRGAKEEYMKKSRRERPDFLDYEEKITKEGDQYRRCRRLSLGRGTTIALMAAISAICGPSAVTVIAGAITNTGQFLVSVK
jgi:hypothetical protein